MRYWTSDWHLNSEIVRQTSNRPWKTAEEMNTAILRMTYNSVAKMDDQIVHVGDLIQSGKDRGTEIPKDKQMKWYDVMMKCRGMLIPVEGNHDVNNDVPSICRSMKTRVGQYAVTVGHYPTWFKEAKGTYVSGRKPDGRYYPTVHICGHVHGSWKVAYDYKHSVLNVNVGIDAHKYRLLSDADLVELIDKAYRWFKLVDTSARSFKDYSFKQWENDCARRKQVEASDKKAKELEWLKANKPEIYAMRTGGKT